MTILPAKLTEASIPNIGQDTIDHEDERWKEYLKEHGYDIDTLGTEEFKNRRHSIQA
jgi:hypothetical protein